MGNKSNLIRLNKDYSYRNHSYAVYAYTRGGFYYCTSARGTKVNDNNDFILAADAARAAREFIYTYG